MGKKGSSANKKVPVPTPSSHSASITLRQESNGKKQQSVSAKSMLKMNHIKNLAIWAGGEASIPSLGAFFGHRLAAIAEALDVSPDPSLLSCQRCESILQPGYNCTVRIERSKAKVKHRRKKSNLVTQNSVVYRCHVCSHRNLKRGTPKHYMKDFCPPKAKPVSRSEPMKLTIHKASKTEVVTEINDTVNTNVIPLEEVAKDDPTFHAPPTPITTVGTTLLDSKRRKRTRPAAKKAIESGSCPAAPDTENPHSPGASSKRKRKSWTSLKGIAERDEQENRRNLTNLAIPFVI